MNLGDFREDYQRGALDRAALNANPITQFEGWFREATGEKSQSRWRKIGIALYKLWSAICNHRPADINAFENLMLLCGDCHHLIDTHQSDYSVETLKEHKREHEERIYALTALGPEQRTTVIQLRGTIGGQPVDIPGTDIEAALRVFTAIEEAAADTPVTSSKA